MKVFADGAETGVVTSGCLSPTLDVPIAMAIVGIASAAPGTAVEVDFGRERAGGEVVPLPFYKPAKT